MEQPPYGPPYEPSSFYRPTRDERTWAMLCHVVALPGLLFFLGHIVAPLVLWLIKRESSAFVDDQGKEAVNFQITASIAIIISGLLVFVFVGMVLLPLVVISWIVLVLIATIKANEGVAYRYPFSIRFIK